MYPTLMEPMNILIACEFSGTVRDAFRRRGHKAVSNDLLEDESKAGGPHIIGDCVDVIQGGPEGGGRWDLIIAHPPCTALAVSGNRHYAAGASKHPERVAAIRWTLGLWELMKTHSVRCAMENPVGVLPVRPSQYIQPWQFGHGETKKTGLWLHGLDPLVPTDVVDGRSDRIFRMPPTADRWKMRSLTYPGIAEAMAVQWG